METYDIKDFDFTDAAWESWYDVADNTNFSDKDSQIIYNSLKKSLIKPSFGDYLKRYIYEKAGITKPFNKIEIDEYRKIIKNSFLENHTPSSFTTNTTKLSASLKNWLEQQTVKRKVVFLLGFGLNMSVDDVNEFLTKALYEREINPKDPFEVICWYCYHKRYNYLKFEQLWELYINTPPNLFDRGNIYSEMTIGVKNSMSYIDDDSALIAHLAKLKVNENTSIMSLTARQCFDELYNEVRDLIAKMYNSYETERHENDVRKYINRLSNNDRLYDSEKQKRIEKFKLERKVFDREDITGSDIEDILYAAIPLDKHGNLTPSKASKLNEQFAGKRLNRQRISDIISGNTEITRFDLITLNFFVFSQKLDEYPDSNTRYFKFCESTNSILEKCFLGELYIQNPYEHFILLCILSDEPLGTYADVWELSYK